MVGAVVLSARTHRTEHLLWTLIAGISVLIFVSEAYFTWYISTIDPRGPGMPALYQVLQLTGGASGRLGCHYHDHVRVCTQALDRPFRLRRARRDDPPRSRLLLALRAPAVSISACGNLAGRGRCHHLSGSGPHDSRLHGCGYCWRANVSLAFVGAADCSRPSCSTVRAWLCLRLPTSS